MSERRIPTGLPSLDRALGGGLVLGATYIITGPPGCGKTSLAILFAVPATKGHWTTTGGVTRWHPGTPGIPARPGPELCASSCDPGEGEPVAACPEVGLVGCCDFGATFICDYAPTSEEEARLECIGGAWATRVP